MASTVMGVIGQTPRDREDKHFSGLQACIPFCLKAV